MRKPSRLQLTTLFLVVLLFGAFTVVESTAWARAGGGGSSGSRGSRSFSTPKMPSNPSTGPQGFSTPGRNPAPGSASGPSSGFTAPRSPFWQGLAGGLAGGLLGNMLFGGASHAAPGSPRGAGIGLLDVAILGALLYFAWRFFKRRRAQTAAAGYGAAAAYSEQHAYPDVAAYHGASQFDAHPPASQVEQGFQQIRQYDPDFSPEALKETFQDIFFRIQAAWMNRSLEGSDALLTAEMAAAFEEEFTSMKQRGRVNRLENIAIRKVEPTEVWQEMGREYVTVLFTANLLDYTLDDQTGAVVAGDRTHPIKFQEFWTFCRDIGSSRWQLSAINQTGE